jgi:hypothetical protein
MATTTTFTMDLRSSWSKRQVNSDSTIILTDVGTFRANETATAGVGTQQVDCLWHIDSTVLGSGESHDYDLFALPVSNFGISGNISFEGGNIKGIIVQNLSEDNGADISICATGAEPFTAPWGGGSGGNVIGALCQLPLINITDGFGISNLSSSAHVISINDDAGSGVEYQILIFGVTGVLP